MPTVFADKWNDVLILVLMMDSVHRFHNVTIKIVHVNYNIENTLNILSSFLK